MDHDHLHDHDHDHHHEHLHSRGGRVFGWIKNYLAPHSHDAADTVDDALIASAEGMKALKISLLALALTAAAQVVVVVITGSVALLADTIHNFSDALTALPLGVAFILARRPATRRYTYGYGRAEDLAGIFIIAMIAFSAGVAAWVAVQRLIHPRDIGYYGMIIIAGLIGFVGNEFAASYRIRVGRRIGSAALVADGLHARTDALTSLAVVLGALGAWAGWHLADPIVGLLICVAILTVLRQAARDVYRRLMDGVDPNLVDTVEATLLATEGIQRVDAVRLRWIGHELFGQAEVVSDGALSLVKAHEITERARFDLLHRVPRLVEVIIHSKPE
ncbi:MAG: cation diffusion facilitator family transporter [Ilumatobacteraceae bacterium]